ncbi:MAG: BlaI family penicillinase repressor [Sphingobacteriales bacterium]|jgi:BlaI family penicillinase repressor
MMKMELTKAEEQVMQILWKLEKAFVKEIISEMPKPKPAYNTVSTIVRILEEKGIVAYSSFGKSHQYYPNLSKEQYTDFQLNKITTNYFKGNFANLVSFFVKENNVDIAEVEFLLNKIKEGDNE